MNFLEKIRKYCIKKHIKKSSRISKHLFLINFIETVSNFHNFKNFELLFTFEERELISISKNYILEKNFQKIRRTFFEREEKKGEEAEIEQNVSNFFFFRIPQNIHTLKEFKREWANELREIYSKTTREIVPSRGKNGRNRRE